VIARDGHESGSISYTQATIAAGSESGSGLRTSSRSRFAVAGSQGQRLPHPQSGIAGSRLATGGGRAAGRWDDPGIFAVARGGVRAVGVHDQPAEHHAVRVNESPAGPHRRAADAVPAVVGLVSHARRPYRWSLRSSACRAANPSRNRPCWTRRFPTCCRSCRTPKPVVRTGARGVAESSKDSLSEDRDRFRCERLARVTGGTFRRRTGSCSSSVSSPGLHRCS